MKINCKAKTKSPKFQVLIQPTLYHVLSCHILLDQKQVDVQLIYLVIYVISNPVFIVQMVNGQNS